MDAESVDAIVTDPPAGINFMSMGWDSDKGGRDQWIEWMTKVAIECLRVSKPGGHALVWALPRTSHWTATAWENAGWECRDRVVHIFGSGFPKSMNIQQAINKAANGHPQGSSDPTSPNHGKFKGGCSKENEDGRGFGAGAGSFMKDFSIGRKDDDGPWNGYGTALKPAHEDWILLRKPLEGTVAQNVLKHGCGGINIDGCRVETVRDRTEYGLKNSMRSQVNTYGEQKGSADFDSTKGRFPANLILDDSDEVRELFPNTKSGAMKHEVESYDGESNTHFLRGRSGPDNQHGDSGSAARFFYCAKASRSERGVDNKHPTVKSLNLMRYLCKLITPSGGIVLDPFAGSGSTGVAAKQEGFQSILIELERESYETANARMRGTK
jgi:site-specific DNA-methyltransferase (adenine-specific)